MSSSAFERKKGWGFLALMRFLEQRAGSKPKVGKNDRLRDDVAQMGQDPFMHFADSDLSDVDLDATPPIVRPRFLGLFGPFGPLPNAMTRDVDHWARNGDRSFVRFADILSSRFQQLFYRSWSDARAITQFDHPTSGQFPDHLRAFTGDTGAAYQDISQLNDIVRLRYTPLALGRVKSAVKLREILKAHFKTPIKIEEFVSGWLEFPTDDLSHIGRQSSSIGRDMRIGSRTRSVSEAITIHVHCPDKKCMDSLSPGRDKYNEFKDLTLSYLGPTFDITVALWLPKPDILPIQLGTDTSELGRLSALPNLTKHSNKPTDEEGGLIEICRFRISHN